MSTCPFDDDWVPAQVKKTERIDFRAVAYGPRGYKVKNENKFVAIEKTNDAMEIDDAAPVRLGRQSTKIEGLGRGRIAKRCWKKRGAPACAMKYSSPSMSLDRIQKERQSKKMFRQAKKELREARGARLKELRERHERAEQRKKENRQKSAVVEKISNVKTLKKMLKSKKQSKLLMKTA